MCPGEGEGLCRCQCQGRVVRRPRRAHRLVRRCIGYGVRGWPVPGPARPGPGLAGVGAVRMQESRGGGSPHRVRGTSPVGPLRAHGRVRVHGAKGVAWGFRRGWRPEKMAAWGAL